MRHTLAGLEWDAKEWESFAISPLAGDLAIDEVAIGGTATYANKQAEVLRRIAYTFFCGWYNLLRKFPDADVPWLKECRYPPPPHIKRGRLISNVKQYHPAFYTPENDPCHDGEIVPDFVDDGRDNAIVDGPGDILDDLL